MAHIPLQLGKLLYAVVGGSSESLDRKKSLNRKKDQKNKGT
jgi:hypothetical protein